MRLSITTLYLIRLRIMKISIMLPSITRLGTMTLIVMRLHIITSRQTGTWHTILSMMKLTIIRLHMTRHITLNITKLNLKSLT
jgi:hypothetical protein